ncbi:MAG: hypothetical protein IJR45_01020 [Firmicutes bacterium]|nr:hypothetical protein [Bacillota bacterium]MBQ9603973.1 hypothetical protein [Bacillota bacterium]
MTDEIATLKQQADEAKVLYRLGHITRAEAEKMIAPYKEAFNKKSKEIAAKYNMRPKLFSVAAFLR